MYKSGSKNIWTLVLLMLAGIVFGGFLGESLGKVPHLEWLLYGKEFGLTNPFVLELGIISFQFALTIRFTIAGILGIMIAIFAYRKLL